MASPEKPVKREEEVIAENSGELDRLDTKDLAMIVAPEIRTTAKRARVLGITQEALLKRERRGVFRRELRHYARSMLGRMAAMAIKRWEELLKSPDEKVAVRACKAVIQAEIEFQKLELQCARRAGAGGDLAHAYAKLFNELSAGSSEFEAIAMRMVMRATDRGLLPDGGEAPTPAQPCLP